MSNTNDGRSHNQPPSHEASVKGGEHSHKNQSGSNADNESTSNRTGEKNSGHNQPSHEASVKGGQHSHGGR